MLRSFNKLAWRKVSTCQFHAGIGIIIGKSFEHVPTIIEIARSIAHLPLHKVPLTQYLETVS